MSKQTYGFVYLWFDRKYHRYYIGSHWGTEDDGYICSSNWMRMSYVRRPEDFRRRIIARIYTNHRDLLIEEERWLSMTRPEEMKPKNPNPRYYNLNTKTTHHWLMDENGKRTVSEKISAAKKGKSTGPCSPEKAARISGSKKKSFEQRREDTGFAMTDEHRQKLSESHIGYQYSEERRKQTSERVKKQWEDGERHGGYKFSDEAKAKLSAQRKGVKQRPEVVQARIEKQSLTWIVTCPDGSEIIVKNLRAWCIEHGLSQSNMTRTTSGHRGYKARKN